MDATDLGGRRLHKKLAFQNAEADALVKEMQVLSFKNEETDPFTKAIFFVDSILAYNLIKLIRRNSSGNNHFLG